MNIQLQTLPHVETPTDRLAVTLFVAFVVHLFVVFGIAFDFERSAKQINTKLDIVLVQTKTDEKPEDAKYLAQANQEGGGEHEEEVRASTPTRAEFPAPMPELTSTYVPPQLAAAEQQEVVQQITAKHSSEKINQQKHQEDIQTTLEETGKDLQTTLLTQQQNKTDLILSARNTVASIQADLDDSYRRFKDRPPHKYINARTKASHYASYMDAWRIKVENLGTEHYPEQARERNWSGSLIMDLALNANGTIFGVKILETSGHSVLDDAAIRIARLGAPYHPFSEAIKKELGTNGVLHIIRTWRFDSQGGFAELSDEFSNDSSHNLPNLPQANGGEVQT